MKNKIIKIIGIFFLGGILGGGIFGLILALLVLGIYYNPFVLIVFSVIVSLFYLPGIWNILTKYKTYLVIFRKAFEIFMIAGFLTTMFSLEEGVISFNNFDWLIIYICLGIVIIFLNLYFILEEYFNQSKLFKEIQHIINGMKLYGVLPNEESKKK